MICLTCMFFSAILFDWASFTFCKPMSSTIYDCGTRWSPKGVLVAKVDGDVL